MSHDEMRDSYIEPPWDDDTVDALNRWQSCGFVHPFTCGKRDDHPYRTVGDSFDAGILTATRDGWVCPDCDYTQTWAHDFMADTPPDPRAWLNSVWDDMNDRAMTVHTTDPELAATVREQHPDATIETIVVADCDGKTIAEFDYVGDDLVAERDGMNEQALVDRVAADPEGREWLAERTTMPE